MRHTFYEDEDFILQYNFDKGQVLIHCEVDKWSLSSLKKGYRIFAEMMDTFRSVGYEKFYTVTPNPKFCELLGGTKIEGFKENGHEVYVWELK